MEDGKKLIVANFNHKYIKPSFISINILPLLIIDKNSLDCTNILHLEEKHKGKYLDIIVSESIFQRHLVESTDN